MAVISKTIHSFSGLPHRDKSGVHKFLARHSLCFQSWWTEVRFIQAQERRLQQCWGCVTIRSSARELSHCRVSHWCVHTHTQKELCASGSTQTRIQTKSWFSTASVLLFWHTLFSFCLISFLFSPPRLFLTTPKIWRFSRVCVWAPQLYGNQVQTGKWPPSLVGTPLSSTPLLPQTKSCLDTCWEWCWD